ncbi:MAG: iron ABC transporter permease [bacterium]|nr:iron ABC transporter permease [Myxococcales bacterium]
MSAPRPLSLALLGALALGLGLLAVFVGATDRPPADVVAALLGGADVDTRLVVVDIRLPRAVAALVVGGALGAAGAVMQVITQNPLAGPGIMGLNGGGALAVLAVMVTVPGASLGALALASLAGSTLAALLVTAIARSLKVGMTPLGLTLVGAAVAALFGALSGAIVIASSMQNDMLYWTVGGLGTLDWGAVALLAAGVLPAAAVTLWLTPALTGLLLGEETAIGLGHRVERVRLWGIAAVVVAAGLSTAVAGPVAFVGLMAPHGARAIFGHDQRWVVPAAALIGAAAVQAADVIGRVATAPSEIPMGVFLGLCGAPLLVWLVAGKRVAALT